MKHELHNRRNNKNMAYKNLMNGRKIWAEDRGSILGTEGWGGEKKMPKLLGRNNMDVFLQICYEFMLNE